MRPGNWKIFPMGRKKGVTIDSCILALKIGGSVSALQLYHWRGIYKVSNEYWSSCGARAVEVQGERKLLRGPGNDVSLKAVIGK